jgi:biopolymer transport protein TolQ
VEKLSFFEMITNAGPMVKFVMLLLLVFSVTSWSIIFMKHILYKRARAESKRFLTDFWKSRNLAEAYRLSQDVTNCPEALIFSHGYLELQKVGRSRDVEEKNHTLDMQLAAMDNLKRTLRKAENLEIFRMGSYLSFLATTGSATPFIGLFGTVWGIMTAFQEIGMRGSASLAVVAPGISEALVATAAGLAVAIPAVIFYNYFSNILVDLENEMQNFSSDLLNLVERDLLSKIHSQANL